MHTARIAITFQASLLLSAIRGSSWTHTSILFGYVFSAMVRAWLGDERQVRLYLLVRQAQNPRLRKYGTLFPNRQTSLTTC